jgi:hypothetical protein
MHLSYPTSVEPLAEVLQLPNPLTMDVLTYMVRGNQLDKHSIFISKVNHKFIDIY